MGFQERKRLLNTYLRSAERWHASLIRAGEWDEGHRSGNDLPERDDCWEPAYQMLMTALCAARATARKSYAHCSDVARHCATNLPLNRPSQRWKLFETLI